MRRVVLAVLTIGVGCLIGFMIASNPVTVHGQGSAVSIAAVSGVVGGQDTFGPYDVAKNWPADISTVPGNEQWTWGAGQGIYAENPDRVFLLFRGELPNIKRPPTKLLPDFGASLSFPIGRLPWRAATVAALPGAGGTGQDPEDGPKLWKGTVGVDAKWEHCLTIVDSKGNITQTFPQYDHLFKRPHFVAINPYDPDKYVWIVDDHMPAIYKFTHDMKGTPPNEKRPSYMNNVHGLAFDPQTKHVFVNDRGNHRIQVFDENGKYLYEWSLGAEPSDVHLIYIGADRTLWAFDRGTSKMLKYDLEGHFLYSWGTWGEFPGGFWGVHGFSVDQDGNFYVAEVDSGRAQKFTPRAGANPAFMVSKPVYAAWK